MFFMYNLFFKLESGDSIKFKISYLVTLISFSYGIYVISSCNYVFVLAICF